MSKAKAKGDVKPYGEIYVVTNKVNGKQYVGQTTVGAVNRWYNHKADAKSGRGRLIGRAIRKYGLENFTFDVVSTSDNQDDLNVQEVAWIAQCGSRVPNGYNLKEGGARGKQAPESIEKIRVAQKGKPRHTPESKAKIGDANRGKILSEETKSKMGASKKGVPKSLETRQKLSVARTGTKASPETCAKLRIAKQGTAPSPACHEASRLASIGRKKSPEEIERIRNLNLGKKASPETRAKQSAAQKARHTRKLEALAQEKGKNQ